MGSGLLGVYIHNIKDNKGFIDIKGKNPFEYWYITENGVEKYFSQLYKTYDYINDNGYQNLGDWIEEAAQ